MISVAGLKLRPKLIALGLVLALAACDSAEERAEGHYQSGLALLEEGDLDRARVEFQSVFKYNGKHRDARLKLAQIHLDRKNYKEAVGQFLRVIEQYPDDLTARSTVARLAILTDNWDAANEQITKLKDIAPEDAMTRALVAASDYRQAVRDDDTTARREAAARSAALVEELPEESIPRILMIDSLNLDQEFTKALELLDEAQELFPEERRLYDLRLRTLSRLGDIEGTEATLREMVDRFPDDGRVTAWLMKFYSDQQNTDGVEDFLRSRITPSEPDDDARVSLVQFLTDYRDRSQAIEALNGFVEEGTNDNLFRRLRAALYFDEGRSAEAISELEAILDEAEEGTPKNDTRVTLAQILSRTGNEVGARALVESVLENDPSMVNALRMKAAWLIEADETDTAIVLLRQALDQDPSNSLVLRTLAQAYLRAGERDLAGEMLSLAVVSSNRAPDETLAYASFLIQDEKYASAETVLIDALRPDGSNLRLLRELARVYVALEDWPRAEQTERTIRALGTEEATELADGIKVALLTAQQRNDDAISLLERLSETSIGRNVDLAIIRTYLADNDPEAALLYVERLIEEDGENNGLQFIRAGILAAGGDLDGAEQTYRQLMNSGFGQDTVYLELVRVLNAKGRPAEAIQTVADGLEKFPQSPDLLWAQAGILERRGDVEGAITIYEDLYDRNTATSVIANNLASLLSTARNDEASLDRAYRVARRLRDSDFPPYQDTYGWIAFRRGAPEEALDYLRPAAAAMPNDPLVRFHLAMTYDALDLPTQAIEEFEAALTLAGDDPRPDFQTARERLEALKAERDNPAPSSAD